MKRNKSIKLKAAILLIVFVLNTILGFACSVGLDMGFNHHHHEEGTEISTTHHDEDVIIYSSKTSVIPFENCCNQKVIEIARADKQVSASIHITIPFFNSNTDFLHPGIVCENLLSQVENTTKWYLVQGHHPPIIPIYIVVQNFRI